VKQYFHVYNVDICMYVCMYMCEYSGGGEEVGVKLYIVYSRTPDMGRVPRYVGIDRACV